MKTRIIGQSGLEVSAIGLGCMAMSEFYGSSDEKQNMATLNRAIELGVKMLDTADLYGDGENERLLGRFLKQTSARPLIATKCGIVRTDEILSDGNFRRDRNGSPDYIRRSVEASIMRLGVETIDLFYLHRTDPNVPVEDSMGALADLKIAGKIRAIGISEPTPEELRRAVSVVQIDAVQSEYSLWTRLIEAEVLPEIRRIGAALVCYSPLGRGLLRQGGQMPALEKGDFRRTLARFNASSFVANQHLFDTLDAVATEAGIEVSQIMLAWLLAQGENVIPIPGARRIINLEKNVAATEVSLTAEQMQRLSDTFAEGAVAGGRYTEGKSLGKT